MTDGEMNGSQVLVGDQPAQPDPAPKVLADDELPADAKPLAPKPPPGTIMSRWVAEWNDVLLEIANGSSMKRCCEKRGIQPGHVYQWLIKNKERKAEYDAAYTIQADVRADEIDELGDLLEKNGNEMSSAQVQALRVAIDAKKWAASIRNSKKYADRRTIEVETPERPEDAKKELERLRRELGPALSLVKDGAA